MTWSNCQKRLVKPLTTNRFWFIIIFMKNRIRFKTHPRETGLASIGAGDPDIDIKINGKICGYISHPTWRSKDNSIRIRLMVYKDDNSKDENTNRNWEWITLKFIPKNDTEAREFMKKYVNQIVEKYNLRYDEED